MLDEALEDFISQGPSTKACHDKPKHRDINTIAPQLIIYPPSQKPQVPNEPVLILEPPKNNPLLDNEIFSQQMGYNTVSHTYNTRNNRQQQTTPISLPLPQPIFPSAPHLHSHSGKEYDLVEKLKNTPAKISLWDMIQASPNYHSMLQTTLQQIMVPPNTNSNNVVALVQGINVINLDIVFHQK